MEFSGDSRAFQFPEGPARQIDVSRQKLSPHCLEAIFDSQLPSPKRLLKCLPNCLSPTREGFLSSFKINPAVRVIARQVRDKNCLAAIFAPRHQSVSSGPLGLGSGEQFASLQLPGCNSEIYDKRPESRGFKKLSEFRDSSLQGTKAAKLLFLLCFGAIREGRMICDRSLLTS